MKKKMMSERRVLIGLIGLLFLMGFVHTMGILSLSKKMTSKVQASSQKAQVATLSLCLQITPAYNMLSTSEQNGMENAGGQGLIATYMYWNVKNVCSGSISIINAGVYNTSNNPQIFSLQARTSNGSIVNVSPSSFASYGVSEYGESTDCQNCGAAVIYPATVPYANSSFDTYTIPSQATRLIRMTGWYKKTHSPQWSLRLYPKSIRWINQSSVTDGAVSAGEPITTPIPASSASAWASDFVEGYYIQ